MNWGQNKFLIGFGAIMVAGCGALGFLIFQSAGQFSELSAQYDQQSAELQRLQNLPLYPEQANLQKLKDQRQVAADSAVALQKQLEPMSFPLESITPEQFQDKLRATVSALVEKADGVGVKLPKNFYLGFDEYLSRPPKTEAAPVLDRQLKAIDLALNTLIENKVDAISGITRMPLSEEGDVAKPQLGKVAGSAPASKAPLLSKFPFQVQFSADQSHFQRVMNDLARNQKQFFIIRPVSIKNDKDKPLSKIDPVAAAAAARAAANPDQSVAGDNSTAPKAQNLRYVLGTEKLNVTLSLEMVVFASSFPK